MTGPVNFNNDPGNLTVVVTLNGVTIDPKTLPGYGVRDAKGDPEPGADYTIRDDGLIEYIRQMGPDVKSPPNGLETWNNGILRQRLGSVDYPGAPSGPGFPRETITTTETPAPTTAAPTFTTVAPVIVEVVETTTEAVVTTLAPQASVIVITPTGAVKQSVGTKMEDVLHSIITWLQNEGHIATTDAEALLKRLHL